MLINRREIKCTFARYNERNMDIQGKRIAYVTLGCKLNFSETSTIRHRLEAMGGVTVDEAAELDAVVVNTCSVTDVAERKGRQLLRKIVREHPGVRLIVVGCYAQLRADEMRAIPGVTLVLGEGEKFDVERMACHIADGASEGGVTASREGAFELAYSYGDRTRCFLKIQDGCDYFCSYCTIPFARGRSRSATIAQVLTAAGDVARRGVKEIILTGVNTGDFGRGRGETFLDLLQALEGLDGVERYRISSIEPNLLTSEVISFVAASRRFMPHFHIPLQAGSDEVLRLMGRRYRRDLFAERVQEIRAEIPAAFIGVDVIAGMRGETLDAFEDGVHFVEELDISRLHVFPYSERAGTRALAISLAVPPAEKHRRVEILLGVSDRKLQRFYRMHEGTVRPVLFEETDTGGWMSGFTDNYIRVEVPCHEAWANRVMRVRLGKMKGNGNVEGEILTAY